MRFRMGRKLEKVDNVEKHLRDREDEQNHERATQIALEMYDRLIKQAQDDAWREHIMRGVDK